MFYFVPTDFELNDKIYLLEQFSFLLYRFLWRKQRSESARLAAGQACALSLCSNAQA
jgi:hypothetical protein